MVLSIFLVIISSLLGVVGQISLKMGMERLGILELKGPANIVQTAFPVSTAPLVLLRLGFYGLGAVV